ncbi:MAG: energy-coupling factor ABC transporter ATP-binding protein, partial [Actinobacteria bacterium]|nr:energy-coupling factor ABC transporter ATP-binding protein [Actinomycetota bacterium]
MFKPLEEKKENKKSIIRIKNFSFSYSGGDSIIRDISLEIREREKILILGPSGCGKSTLTLCLNGIIPQLIEGSISGSIEIDDMDVAGTPVSILSQKVGIVFQDPESQFCMLKVEDEVAFGLENLMYEREKMKKKIAESLDRVEMSRYSGWLLNNLSGGMKQRVALASLLAINQDILIFDEPTSNLDPLGTREVSEIIRKLPENKTLIIIEHKLDDFIDIFDKVILFDGNGKIIAFTTTEKLFLDFMPELRKTGVWIPQIPKFFYNLDQEEGISFDIFPLSGKEANAIININSANRDRVLNILDKEITKEVIRQDDTELNKNIIPYNFLIN